MYSDGMSIKVFIFEDNWMCREALVSVLGSEEGIEVVGAAANIRDGMDQVVTSPPDVVLMDIRFNDQNLGIEATAKLLELLPGTKVIIFTGFSDEDTLRRAIDAGAAGFLLKSEVQDPETIARAIRSVCTGGAYITPSITATLLKLMKCTNVNSGFELTNRELQILKLIAEGRDNKGIATVLNIEVRTVANHVSNILFKMNARNRTEASAIARREGLLNETA
jgi:NarL family two-component system response regulator LiaR